MESILRYAQLFLRGRSACLASFVALAATGCTGSIATGTSPSGPADSPDPATPGAPGRPPQTGNPGTPPKGDTPGSTTDPAPTSDVTGAMPLRRLSKTELSNTVVDLLGATPGAYDALPNDPIGESTYRTAANVGAVERDRLEQAADAIAGGAASKIATLAPCASGANERDCAATFVKSFGKRAFRRPLTDGEVDNFLALYDKLRVAPISYSYTDSARTIVSAFLQSPQFLYHWQLGDAKATKQGALVRLNGWEIASRLSYLFWGTMPDADLFAAAEGGRLDDAAAVEAQAKRLLENRDRSKHLAVALFGQWLNIEAISALQKDPKVIATLVDDIKAGMTAEAEKFLQKAVVEDGSWTSLLTSRNSFVTAATAKLYGMTGVTATTPTATMLPAERTGFFTQLAFLALKALPQESSPVHRGKLVLNRLLCRQVDPPPPGLNVVAPKIPEGSQTREAYAIHGKEAACVGCHSMMDPLGFAFENFDAVGRYRKQEAGRDVDASGEVTLDGAAVKFNNATALMDTLAKSPEARGCAVTQVMRFALLRKLGPGDQAAIAAATKEFVASGDLRALAVSIARSDSFRLRTPAIKEVLE